MAMASILLFIICISFNNCWCSIPGQDHQIISKVFRDRHLAEVTTEENMSLKNCPNNYGDSSGEGTYITNSNKTNPEGSLDYIIPYSEHEHPKEVSTRPNYTAPGKWAKPYLEFVPTKLYAQVRASHTIKREPQEEALEAAEAKEDKENAARLREVVTNSKVATIYTEEGYEDFAYDHGGHVRDADFHESDTKEMHNQFDHESERKSIGSDTKKVKRIHPKSKDVDDYSHEYIENLGESTAIVELESRTKGKLAKLSEKGKLNKNAEKNFKGELNNSEIHPRLAVEEEIDQLKSEIKYSNAEADKASEIYGAEKLTKLKEDYDVDKVNLLKHQTFRQSSDLRESQNFHDTGGSDGELKENWQLEKVIAPVYTVRSSKEPATRKTNSQTNFKASGKRREHNKEINFAHKNNRNFSRVTPRFEETTYLKPDSSTINPAEDYRVFTLGYTMVTEMPTTINYGEMFWKYFKYRQSQRAALHPKIFKEKPTIYPDTITMENINEHGPCLVVTKNRNNDKVNVLTPSPLENHVSPVLINNLANNPTAESRNLQWPFQTAQRTGNNENMDKVSDNIHPDSLAPTIKSLKLSDIDYEAEVYLNTLTHSSRKEDLKYSSTPTSYSIPPLEPYGFLSHRKTTHYDHNPFLVQYARTAKANIPRYTVLIRTQDDHSGENITSSQSLNTGLGQIKLKELSNNKQIPLIQSITKHEKRSNHLGNQRKFRPIKNKVNTRPTEDFIFLKPSPRPSPEVTHSNSQYIHSYDNATDHSLMRKNSRRLEERRHRLSAISLENHVGVNTGNIQKKVNSTISKRFPVSPRKTAHGEKLFHILYLRPPIPFNKSVYAEYRIRRKRSSKKIRSTKIVKGVPSRNSVEVESISILGNNFQRMKKRSSSIKRRIKRNIRNESKSDINFMEPEVKLLNESPKIIDEVIKDEVKKGFKNTGKHIKHKNEKSVNKKNENIEIEIPELEYVDEFNSNNILNSATTLKMTVDIEKYPFYGNDAIPSSLALNYIVNPKRVPKKTLGGMEFYDSRNFSGCNEVNLSLENVVPAEEEPAGNRDLKKYLPRLHGLGEKLDCFKTKYFDANPLDNPLFLESHVEEPALPAELNTRKLVSRIQNLQTNKDEYISLQMSTNTEPVRFNTQIGGPKFQSLSDGKRTALGNIARTRKHNKIKYNPFNTIRRLLVQIKNESHRTPNHRYYKIPNLFTTDIEKTNERYLYATIPYQAEVYKDVMGTIRNFGHMNNKVEHESFSTTITTTSLSMTTPHTVASTIAISPLPRLHPTTSAKKYARHVSDSLRQEEMGIQLIDIKDKSFRLYPTKIEGLVPNLEGTRILGTIPYKNKIAHRMDLNNEPRVNNNFESFLGYYRITQLKKRSTNSTDFPTSFAQKKFKRSVATTSLKFPSTKSQISNRFKPVQTKRTSIILMSALSETAASIPFNTTKKIVYTIRDIIKNSKPKEEYGKYGKFTMKPTTLEIDSRRQEPKYNPIIKRRNRSITFLPSTSLPIATSITELNISRTFLPSSSSNITRSLLKNQESKRNQSIDEQKEEDSFKTNIPFKHKNRAYTALAEKLNEDQDKSDNNSRHNAETEKASVNQYDVYEDVSDAKPHAELLEYLRFDPPRYDEAFGKVNYTEKPDQHNLSSMLDDRKEREGEDAERSSECDDTSENTKEYSKGIAVEPQNEKNYEDQLSSLKSKDINDDDRRFEGYDIRPFSPSTNFKEYKYADLGSRLRKPAFYHPPFIVPEYEMSHPERIINSSDVGGTEESGSIEKYSFQWENAENVSQEGEEEEKEAEEDEDKDEYEGTSEETQHFSRIIESYKYPWEERKTKEKRNKEKVKLDTQRKYAIDFDVATATSDKKERYAYPWDRYNVPSKDYLVSSKSDFWRFNNTFNNDERTTEYYLAPKFSIGYRHQPSNDMNARANVTSMVQTSLSIPLSQEGVQRTFNYLSTPRSFSKLLNIGRLKLSITPKTTSTLSNRMTSSVNEVPELVKKALKRNESIKTLNLKKVRMNTTLRGFKSNLEKPLQVKAITAKPATSTAIIDTASKTILKRNFAKRNSRISKVGKFDEKQINTSKVQNRRRSRSHATTVSPKVTILTKEILANRRSPFERFVLGDRNFNKNVSSDLMASARSVSSMEYDFDFHIPTPASQTIEHRSRVSEKEIITKTVYPNEDTFFDKNKSDTDNQDDIFYSKEIRTPIKREKVKSRKSKKPKKDNLSVSIKEIPNHVYQTKEIDNDGVKEMNIMRTDYHKTTPFTKEAQLYVETSMPEANHRKTHDNEFRFDGIHIDGDNQASKLGTTETSNIDQLSNRMKNISLKSPNKDGKLAQRRISIKSNIGRREDVQTNRREPPVAFFRDPGKRMYYYVDHHE